MPWGSSGRGSSCTHRWPSRTSAPRTSSPTWGACGRRPGTEVLYARSRVALAARLAGVLAVDQVVTRLDAEDHFLADAALGRAIGYRGKLCIHPAQVTLANRAFSSSPEELERARRLLAAYDDAVARGEAAIAFEGQMVDEPLARHARAVLAAAAPA